jgi:hypothetical protein
MITKEKMRSLLGRVALMKYFPNDAMVLCALAEEVNNLCDDGDTATDLVSELIRDYHEWPGVHTLQAIAHSQHSKRQSKLQIKEGRNRRDIHEGGCPGFIVNVDELDRTLSVERCRSRFPGSRYEMLADFGDTMFHCRRGQEITPSELADVETTELEKREGWHKSANVPFGERAA